MLRRSLLLLCVAVAAAVVVAPVAGAPGGHGGGPTKSVSSISLAVPAGSGTTDAWPRYGDKVTFAVSTTATDQPWVNLKCYQNGALVAEGWEGYFDGALGDRIFGLYSPQWTSGAADCTAWLVDYANGRWKQLTSTSFHVAA
jgi:hypothetical protein